MIQPGFAAITAKYGQEVTDFIRSAPQRAYDFAYAYGPQAEATRKYAIEYADNVRAEVERRVARAAKDTTFALEWAAKVVRTNEMENPWNSMTSREKVDAVQQQEYEDELAIYCRNLALLPEIPEPAARTFPARNRAHREAQRIYAETIGPYVYTPRPKRLSRDVAPPIEDIASDISANSRSGGMG